jgi:hypothetical protein
LGEYFAAQPGRVAGYELSGLMRDRASKQPAGSKSKT